MMVNEGISSKDVKRPQEDGGMNEFLNVVFKGINEQNMELSRQTSSSNEVNLLSQYHAFHNKTKRLKTDPDSPITSTKELKTSNQIGKVSAVKTETPDNDIPMTTENPDIDLPSRPPRCIDENSKETTKEKSIFSNRGKTFTSMQDNSNGSNVSIKEEPRDGVDESGSIRQNLDSNGNMRQNLHLNGNMRKNFNFSNDRVVDIFDILDSEVTSKTNHSENSNNSDDTVKTSMTSNPQVINSDSLDSHQPETPQHYPMDRVLMDPSIDRQNILLKYREFLINGGTNMDDFRKTSVDVNESTKESGYLAQCLDTFDDGEQGETDNSKVKGYRNRWRADETMVLIELLKTTSPGYKVNDLFEEFQSVCRQRKIPFPENIAIRRIKDRMFYLKTKFLEVHKSYDSYEKKCGKFRYYREMAEVLSVNSAMSANIRRNDAPEVETIYSSDSEDDSTSDKDSRHQATSTSFHHVNRDSYQQIAINIPVSHHRANNSTQPDMGSQHQPSLNTLASFHHVDNGSQHQNAINTRVSYHQRINNGPHNQTAINTPASLNVINNGPRHQATNNTSVSYHSGNSGSHQQAAVNTPAAYPHGNNSTPMRTQVEYEAYSRLLTNVPTEFLRSFLAQKTSGEKVSENIENVTKPSQSHRNHQNVSNDIKTHQNMSQNITECQSSSLNTQESKNESNLAENPNKRRLSSSSMDQLPEKRRDVTLIPPENRELVQSPPEKRRQLTPPSGEHASHVFETPTREGRIADLNDNNVGDEMSVAEMLLQVSDPNKNPEKKTRDRWSVEETEQLLAAYRENQNDLENNFVKSKKACWEQILATYIENCEKKRIESKRSEKQLRDRIDYLKDKLRDVQEQRIKSFQWYDQMQTIENERVVAQFQPPPSQDDPEQQQQQEQQRKSRKKGQEEEMVIIDNNIQEHFNELRKIYKLQFKQKELEKFFDECKREEDMLMERFLKVNQESEQIVQTLIGLLDRRK